MKNKIDFEYYITCLKYYVKTSKFKFLFALMIVFSLYSTLVLARVDVGSLPYIPAILTIFGNEKFIMLMLSITLITNIIVFDLFNNRNNVLRYNNKKEFVVELLKLTIIFNILTHLMQIGLILINLLLICGGSFGNYTLEVYNMGAVFYAIFIIIKYLILIHCVAVINMLLMNIVNKTFLVGISLLYFVSIVFRNNIVIDGARWKLVDYFLSQPYSSFTSEVFHTFLYVLVLVVFIKIINQFILKHTKKVGE